MKALVTFDFNNHPIRFVEIKGEPWFVAADVAKVLGFNTTAGANWYARHLSPDEKNTITLREDSRGNPRKTVISESGLYKLIMRSDKPQAREFQDWVTRVVLPAIRKDGLYVAGEENINVNDDLQLARLTQKVMTGLAQKIERLQAENAAMKLAPTSDPQPSGYASFSIASRFTPKLLPPE